MFERPSQRMSAAERNACKKYCYTIEMWSKVEMHAEKENAGAQ